MPPKKEVKVSKADVAKKQKAVEDKTFGLKNKNKSKTVQKYVQNLQQSVSQAQKQAASTDPRAAAKKKKEEEAAREKELNDIFRVAISQPKVPLGVDPKSIVCEFYRRGQCTKGFKCKFSHDLNVERKGEKINLYADQRDTEEDDGMEDWDQDKLEEAVAAKGNEYKNSNKPTEIVCKHFLDAIEKRQYGWFWTCPNGGKECMYRHALPPGYVLKSQMKQLLEEASANKLSVEEEIDQERMKIKSSTQLTGEVFAAWKAKKQEAKDAEMEKRRAHRAKEDRMSGRELFASDATLFVDDEEAYDAYQREESDGEAEAPLERPAPHANGGEPSNGAKEGDQSALTEEDERLLIEDDDDDLDLDELDELEASISKTALEDT